MEKTSELNPSAATSAPPKDPIRPPDDGFPLLSGAIPYPSTSPGSSLSKEVIEAETPSSQPKSASVYAEALRKVLEDSSSSQPKTKSTQQMTLPQGSRPALVEITNTSAVQAPKIAAGQGGYQAETSPSDDTVSSGLVNVPVMYQNPTFQSSGTQPKTQMAASKLSKIGPVVFLSYLATPPTPYSIHHRPTLSSSLICCLEELSGGVAVSSSPIETVAAWAGGEKAAVGFW
ncbi:hypothetical protein LINPERPRIM_LOCUS35206 [Linum perenne]